MSTEPIRLIMEQYGVDFGTARHIYETGEYPEPEEPDRETEESLSAFYEWVSKTYSSAFAEHLKTSTPGHRRNYLNYFFTNVYRKPEPLPRGRPTQEKWPVDLDWKALMMLSGSPQRVEAELRKWLSTGYITQFQARDIWSELEVRVRRATTGLLYGEVETAPEAIVRRRKEEIARLKETGERGIAGIPKWQLETWEDRVKAGEITSEEVTRYIERREEAEEARVGRRRMVRAWQYAPPQPEYARAFEEERVGLGGPQPWKSWFESQYPSLVSRFRATLPKMVPSAYPGMYPGEAEEQIEETWAETLRKRRPELREEYATRYPFGMGGRPWAFAPRIQTVGF